MIGIVVSRGDEASVNVGTRLLDRAGWVEFEDRGRPDAEGGGTGHRRDGFERRVFDGLHLDLEGVADAFGGVESADDPELIVFVSRHAGETGPLLTAHFTGNVGPADHGGRPNELAAACPNALARVVEALDRHAPDGYDVGFECTHHGPSDVGAPSMFVEVGSGPDQWRDPDAASAVARAVLDLEGVPPHRERTVIGFGGGHYAPRFRRILRETDWAVGHVVADWAIETVGDVPPSVIEQAFERSEASRALIDGERPRLRVAIEDRGYDTVGETWLRETVGVPLALVEAAESALCPVADGLRFGDRRADAVDVARLNPDLVAAALAVDAEGTLAAFGANAIAFETEEAGNRPTGRVCLPGGETVDPVVDALADVIRSGGAGVDRDGAAVIVRETRFDPERARERGVPAGPAFGRLAGGEAVEVDGETVTPEAVHAERTRRYPIEPE